MNPNAPASTPERARMPPEAPPHRPIPTPKAKNTPATVAWTLIDWRIGGAASKVGRRAALGFAPGDEVLQRLAPLKREGRLRVAAEAFGDDPSGRVGGGRRSRLPPALEIAPVGDHRRKEGGAVTRLRVFGAEEVAARADLADRLQRQFLLLDRQRAKELGDHCEKVGVERHLLERGLQTALHPAGTVHEEIDAAHDRAPQREYALI